MSRFNLRLLARQQGRRRGRRVFRPIVPTAALASDLAGIYLAVVRDWTEALPRILAEYERTLAQLTTDAPTDLQREIDGAENGLLRLFLQLTPRVREWAFRVERWARGRWIGAALSATGINLATVLSPNDVADTVDAAVQWNVGLIRNVSDEARQRISNIVFQGVNQRKPAKEVAAELREAVAMSRARSIRIAADQATKLTARLDQARQEQAGINRYEWMHSGKRHPRENHVARNGKIFSWSEPPVDGHPGSQPFCGCRARAYIDFDD